MYRRGDRRRNCRSSRGAHSCVVRVRRRLPRVYTAFGFSVQSQKPEHEITTQEEHPTPTHHFSATLTSFFINYSKTLPRSDRDAEGRIGKRCPPPRIPTGALLDQTLSPSKDFEILRYKCIMYWGHDLDLSWLFDVIIGRPFDSHHVTIKCSIDSNPLSRTVSVD